MVQTQVQPNLGRLLGISVLLIVLPACQSPGGHGSWFHRQPPGSSNVVMRPTYPIEGTKPLYISGYAGANYGTLFSRRLPAGNPAPMPVANPPGLTINQGDWDTH
jgi:hypothetical protein